MTKRLGRTPTPKRSGCSAVRLMPLGDGGHAQLRCTPGVRPGGKPDVPEAQYWSTRRSTYASCARESSSRLRVVSVTGGIRFAEVGRAEAVRRSVLAKSGSSPSDCNRRSRRDREEYEAMLPA